MKTFLLLAFSLTTALAQVVNGEDLEQVKATKHQSAPPAKHPAVTQAPRFQRNNTVPQQRSLYRAPNAMNTYHAPKVRSFDRSVAPAYKLNQNAQVRPRVRNPNVVATTPQNNVTAQSNFSPRNWLNRNNTNWQNRNNANLQNRTNANLQNRTTANFQNSSTLSWADARRRNSRERHNRSWWSSRYNRFVLFGGGYYYWDNYYWYPAYGYDPYYNSYSYDEPIYGDQDVDPGQLIANVQTELQRLGYYQYAVDGLMGPATRAAIANFQRDNGLPMTSAIDRPTLQTLGLG
jgi:hypothetical protein